MSGCPICLECVNDHDPMVTNCGHEYCSDCLDDLFRNTDIADDDWPAFVKYFSGNYLFDTSKRTYYAKCPNCREVIRSDCISRKGEKKDVHVGFVMPDKLPRSKYPSFIKMVMVTCFVAISIIILIPVGALKIFCSCGDSVIKQFTSLYYVTKATLSKDNFGDGLDGMLESTCFYWITFFAICVFNFELSLS